MRQYLKTAIGSLEDVKNVLEQSDVKREKNLTGGFYLLNRLLNSKKEDIVLNSIVAGANQITENILNVNIHVPNLSSIPSGSPNTLDNTQPDIIRMEAIGRSVLEILDGYTGFDFFLEIISPGEVIPDGKNWYYNIVIKYFFLRRDK